jgi:hypothetical protein
MLPSKRDPTILTPVNIVEDLSPSSIERAVRSRALNALTTIIPGLASALALMWGLVCLVVFGAVPPWVIWGALAGGLASVASFGVNRYFMRDAHASAILAQAREKTKKEQRDVLTGLNISELERYANEDWPGSKMAQTALMQFEQLDRKHQALLQAITEAFNQEGTLFSLHLETAEQVHLALLYRFRDVRLNLMNARTIDLDYVEGGLKETASGGLREQTLLKQKEIYENNLDAVRELVGVIDQALLNIDQLTQVIIDTSSRDEDRLRRICTEMGNLAGRVQQYSAAGFLKNS